MGNRQRQSQSLPFKVLPNMSKIFMGKVKRLSSSDVEGESAAVEHAGEKHGAALSALAVSGEKCL